MTTVQFPVTPGGQGQSYTTAVCLLFYIFNQPTLSLEAGQCSLNKLQQQLIKIDDNQK